MRALWCCPTKLTLFFATLFVFAFMCGCFCFLFFHMAALTTRGKKLKGSVGVVGLVFTFSKRHLSRHLKARPLTRDINTHRSRTGADNKRQGTVSFARLLPCGSRCNLPLPTQLLARTFEGTVYIMSWKNTGVSKNYFYILSFDNHKTYATGIFCYGPIKNSEANEKCYIGSNVFCK